MRTDELIAILSRDEPGPGEPSPGRVVALVALAAFAVTLGLVVASIGARADVAAIWRVPDAIVKHVSLLLLAIALTGAFVASLKPGLRDGRFAGLALLVVAAVAVLAAVELALAPAGGRAAAVVGRNWLACLVFVPGFAVLPFVALAVAGRAGAPVDPARSGALAGLAAGALSAAAYALHCTDDAAPFLLVWYGIAIGACTLAGRLLGPKLLRW